MKRFALHIVLFLAFAALLVALLLWLLGGTGLLRNVTYNLGGADYLYTKSREAERCGSVDVLFIGSSHSYRTFDPRVFDLYGVSSFNLGSSNQSPIQSEVLLYELLDKLNPHLVVFEVHPDILSLDGVEAALYQVCNVKPSWHMIPMALRTKNMKVWCTAVYALLHNSVSSAFDNFDEPDAHDNRYATRGFVERDVEHFSPSVLPADTIKMRKEQLSALRRCVRFMEKHNTPYILLEVPDTKVQTAAYTNLDEFQNAVSQYGEFHYLPIATLDDSLHYYDVSHLNQDGVELYDAYIFEHLLSRKLKENQ